MTGMERALTSTVDQRVLRRFRHVETIDEQRMAIIVLRLTVSGKRLRSRQRFGFMA